VKLLLDQASGAILTKQAADAYPKECCGLLVGRDEGQDLRVTRVVPSANLDPAGGTRAFEIDPALILEWTKRLRGTPERLIGHYHSHPDGPAQPSATDLDHAWEPGRIWLILGVRGGPEGPSGGRLAAFRYEEEGEAKAFVPVALAAVPAGPDPDSSDPSQA